MYKLNAFYLRMTSTCVPANPFECTLTFITHYNWISTLMTIQLFMINTMLMIAQAALANADK